MHISVHSCGMQYSTEDFLQSSPLSPIVTAKMLHDGQKGGSTTALWHWAVLSWCITQRVLTLLSFLGLGTLPSLPPHLTHSSQNHRSTIESNILELLEQHILHNLYVATPTASKCCKIYQAAIPLVQCSLIRQTNTQLGMRYNTDNTWSSAMISLQLRH